MRRNTSECLWNQYSSNKLTLCLVQPRNIRHTFQVILKEEGGFWSGCLYRGIFPTLLGIAPYVGLSFAVYETLKGVSNFVVFQQRSETISAQVVYCSTYWRKMIIGTSCWLTMSCQSDGSSLVEGLLVQLHNLVSTRTCSTIIILFGIDT